MLSMNYTIIDDPSDLPSRRYKMIFQVESEESRWARYHVPLSLAYSADCINWLRPPHVNPLLRGVSDGDWSFIYDRDCRTYQLYTRRVPNLPRDISLYESTDLINWEDKGAGAMAAGPPSVGFAPRLPRRRTGALPSAQRQALFLHLHAPGSDRTARAGTPECPLVRSHPTSFGQLGPRHQRPPNIGLPPRSDAPI